ncbi:MAG: hypothetical protein PF636_02815 [Actinomycetota bacterium]|jgi:hypothetical protein|nr:hypothetical protein [Actinomycetota bacterium]
MLTATTGIQSIRPHYTESPDLLGVLLNATSLVEANFALELLKDTVPEKVLVTALNLREVLRELPSSPFEMSVAEDVLLRTANLVKDRAVMATTLPDGTEIAVTTAGNLVLDVIVRSGGAPSYWSPVPITDNFLTPAVLELVVESDHLLDGMIELAKAMGLVFNPPFYLSLEDWRMDHAADMMQALGDLF